MKTTKRILSLILAVLILVTCIPFAAAETVTGQCGSNVYWSLNENTGVLTISGAGGMTNYDHRTSPFYLNTTIRSVVIEYGVTSIGECSFVNCTNMTSVSIPKSVTRIGDFAFDNCKSLNEVNIPNSVESIGAYAFVSCERITSVSIPSSVSSIDYRAFHYCSALKSFSVSSDNPYFSSDEYGCLYNKDKTEFIRYPLGNSRSSFSIPNSVENICEDAFMSCDNLLNIYIPNSVSNIEEGAFHLCDNLKTVNIPNGIKEINDYTFYSCDSLTSISIPYGVTEIWFGAFLSCRALESVTIPNSVLIIRDSAFQDCDALESVTIPNSVLEIGYFAFQDCDALESVTIPESVTSIYDYAFNLCYNLKEIIVDEDNLSYSSDNRGCLYDKEKTELIQYPAGNTATSFAIPNSVKKICYSAFDSCRLESISIPTSVNVIENSAFKGCYYLEDVYYGGNQAQWNEIEIGDWNDDLLNATLHFNSLSYVPVQSITLNEEKLVLQTGVCYDVIATIFPNNATNKNVSWSSSDPSVADVDSTGMINTLSDGTTTITATSIDGGYSASISVIVFDFEMDDDLFNKTNFNSHGVDNNSFGNTKYCFDNGTNDYNLLDEKLKKAFVKKCGKAMLDEMNDKWGGSCYGIEAMIGMVYNNYYKPNDLANGAQNFFQLCPYNTKLRDNNPKLLDLINMNMCLQSYIGFFGINNYLTFYNNSLSQLIYSLAAGTHGCIVYSNNEFWNKVISEVEKEPIILNYSGRIGNHSVLVTDVYYARNGQIQLVVYDCNNLSLHPSDNTYSPLNSFIVNSNGSVYYTHKKIKENSLGLMSVITVSENIEDSVSYLSFTKLKDIYDVNKNILEMVSPKKSSIMKTNKLEQTNDESIIPNDHCSISFNLQDDIYIKNSDNQYISISDNDFECTMSIYDFRIITKEEQSSLLIETDKSDSFCVFSGKPTEFAVNSDDYFRVYCEKFDNITLSMDGNILVKNCNGDLDISIDKCSYDDQATIIRMSGKSSGNISFSKQSDKVINITSDTSIIDCNIKSITEDNTFSVSLPEEKTSSLLVLGDNSVVYEEEHKHVEDRMNGTEKIATCTSNGYSEIVFYCSLCDKELGREIIEIPALGHIDENSDGRCDRCEKQLSDEEVCPQCGKVHNGGFFDSIIAFFHRLIYRITHLFG